MRSIFQYAYRDAANSRQVHSVAFEGSLSAGDIARFFAHLSDGEYFIAEQVGLPDLRERWSELDSEDVAWHEAIGWTTDNASTKTDHRSAYDFVDEFCATEWDEDAAIAYLENELVNKIRRLHFHG